ncbi:hypothetical protein PC123_g28143 [Phytophthora cactorum]|nr:hypothetical protein PC123_g28143 [Phytophthora cactorum]
MASEFTSNQEKKKKQEARKMAKRSTTVPATPSKSGGARNESSSPDVAAARLAAVSELSVSFEDEEEHGLDVQDDYDDYEDKTPVPDPGAATPKTVTLSSGLSGATKSLSRSAQTATRTRGLATELDDVAGPDPDYDDFNDGTEGSKPSVASAKRSALLNAPRPPINGDTPAAKRVFDCVEALTGFRTRANTRLRMKTRRRSHTDMWLLQRWWTQFRVFVRRLLSTQGKWKMRSLLWKVPMFRWHEC